MNAKVNNKPIEKDSFHSEVGAFSILFVNMALILSLSALLASGAKAMFIQDYCFYILVGIVYVSVVNEHVSTVWKDYEQTVMHYYAEVISQSIAKLGYVSGLFYCLIYVVTKIGLSLF